MVDFTDIAKTRILHFLEVQKSQGVSALRIAGTRSEQKLWLVKASDKRDDDTIQQAAGFEVYIDNASAKVLKGATVDFVEEVMQSGFRLFWPSPKWEDALAQRVQDVIDQQINPGVASHGGRVALTKVAEGAAYVRLEGGCQGCGAAEITLRQGIEEAIKNGVPEITRVLDVTNHAAGENPYYAPQETGPSPVAEEQNA